MKQKWTISALGDARFCVGIAISRNRGNRTVALSQMALIDRIIVQFGQTDAYPVDTPMDAGLKLRKPDLNSMSEDDLQQLRNLPYSALVGILIYLAIGTRPDIAYAVQQLSQFLSSYSWVHWNAAVRVVRYLKGTRGFKLFLGGVGIMLKLLGHTDSDWANCLDTRRSIGGYCFSLGSGLISWAARKQKTVAASSCEAEYMAGYESAKEAIWLRALLLGIGIQQEEPTPLLCDNNATIVLSEDPALHYQVKHVDIKYHFLREHVQSKELKMSYVHTSQNVADAFTKALPTKTFQYLRGMMGLRPDDSTQGGDVSR